ncbi:unnamed protein product [Lepeophtheirus salmonis]|uniref:(salmon louse) hypothetical protein n=1 Tax=Lepeophtheirus salmonis TaxID=72036 RepID=A0A7R8CNW9_LEPSM|nr:unnamed protein product [Lepeophtheirus salmonis]CAF2845249.1 unnamed protein product [Lepeophtheirus salmonis]
MNTFASLLLIAQVASLAYGQGCQTTSGQNCVFPSNFREMALTKCVKADYDKYWCATSNNADGSVDTYGDCNADCPMEVHDPTKECITTGNYQCVFPFEYNGLTYNKCTDADNEEVSEGDKSIDPVLVRPVVEFPTPTTSSQIKPFLDSSSNAWTWRDEAKVSFSKIKKILTNAPILAHHDSTLPLFLSTDASPIGLGAILSHSVNGEDQKPLESYSALNTLSATSSARTFSIKINHRSLQFILNPQKDLPTTAKACLSRCALRLAMFDYNIIHLKGIHNLHSGTLSRGPLVHPEPIINPDATDESMCLAIYSASSSDNELPAAVKEDASLHLVIEAARTGDGSKVTEDSYKKKSNAFSLKNGLLFWGILRTDSKCSICNE